MLRFDLCPSIWTILLNILCTPKNNVNSEVACTVGKCFSDFTYVNYFFLFAWSISYGEHLKISQYGLSSFSAFFALYVLMLYYWVHTNWEVLNLSGWLIFYHYKMPLIISKNASCLKVYFVIYNYVMFLFISVCTFSSFVSLYTRCLFVLFIQFEMLCFLIDLVNLHFI